MRPGSSGPAVRDHWPALSGRSVWGRAWDCGEVLRKVIDRAAVRGANPRSARIATSLRNRMAGQPGDLSPCRKAELCDPMVQRTQTEGPALANIRKEFSRNEVAGNVYSA
jgi:hypothetical protein